MNNPFVMTTKNTIPCCGIRTSINDEVFFLFDCCSFLGLGLSTISLFAEEKDADFGSCKYSAGGNNFVDPVDDDYDDVAKDYYITTTTCATTPLDDTMMEDESLTIVDPPDDDPHAYDSNDYNGSGNSNGKNGEEVTKITNTTGI